jgi:hypothetical protein
MTSTSSRETIRAGSANPTTNARTTTDAGTGRVDHRFATASSTFEAIFAASRAREFASPHLS